jgi:hypothetical protein
MEGCPTDGYPADRYPAERYPEDGYTANGYPESGYAANDDRYSQEAGYPYSQEAGYPQQPGRFRDTDSLWQAWRILNLADGQAASITQWAWAEVNAIHEAAERAAAEVRQQAGNQIAAIRAAAERDAAATIQPVPGEPGRAADYAAHSAVPPPRRPPSGDRGPSLGAAPRAGAAGAPGTRTR